MKISFNPSNSNKNILDLIKNNKDIIFDLKGHSIFARGVEFKGTDTNTWRDIKINNVSIGSHTLDLRNGSNTTLTNTNGVVTINSTWRPVVDNLTSDSTTSSLSAKQGKVLKALIDGKSNSDHNHDGRYLKLTGGTMASNALITFADSGSWSTDKGPQGARGGLYWTGQSDYAKLYAEETVGDNLDLVIQFGDDNSNGLSIRNKANTQTSYISSSGVITTGTFKGNLDWSYITNKPSSYTPSVHTHAWNSLTHSSTTENQAILTNGKANGWKLQTLNIARWDNAANNAHSHANKSVLDGITSALVNSWNTAYNFVSNITGTDTDKVINKWEEIVNFLAGITEDNKLNTLLNSKLSIQQLSAKDILTTKTNNALFWVDTKGNASTITTGPFTDHPYALLSVTNYNQNAENYKFFYRSRLAFSSAGDIKVASCHHEFEYQQDETWYNVLTSKNSGINGSTIKLNGTSITVYSSGTADGRYVKKSGDTMSGVLTIDTTNFGALTIKRNDDAYGASIQFRGKSSVYGYIGLNNSTKDKQFLRWSSDTSRFYTILDTSSTYISNGKGVINGTTITQVDNATNSTNSTNARKLVNWYSARPTSLNAQFGDGSLRIFYATSSTTEGKPAEDSHILHLAWDNTGGYDAQLAVHARSGKVSTRAQNGGTWQPWKTLAFITDIPSSLKNPYSFNVFGVVYDGSAAKTVTTSNFIGQVNEATATITDGTMLITSYASNSGFADTNAVNVPYKRKAIHLWEYIKAKTDSLYATKGHNHDGIYVRAFRTSNDNIDSDWGQSFKTFDPIPLGTPPEKNPNISLLSIGENFNRRKQLAFIWNNDNIYYRRRIDSGFTNWRRLAFVDQIPTSLKNPHALTISLNGTSQGPYDGSAAKNINITPSSIGAAVSNHSHDYLVVNSADDKSFNSAYHNFQVLYAGGDNGITGKPANVNAFGLFKFRAASGWSGQMLLANGGSLYIRSSEDAKMTNTLAWKTILDSSNYSGILDSRYYTESEVNSLLDAKLNRQNLSYGTWNPRGYHLAADYHYNGGDLSISENNGKMYVSVDGCFWQNEGQYRVLDTSDIGDFAISTHTHTVFKNNLMIKGTNGISDSASIHLGIGDSDTGFKWISDGVCQIYANNAAVGQWTSGGMNWFKNPTVNGNKVWNAGNDGSGSGLDADTLDGYHETKFFRHRGNTNKNESPLKYTGGTLEYYGNLPSGMHNVYNWGGSLVSGGEITSLQFYYPDPANDKSIYARTFWDNNDSGWHKLAFTDSKVADSDKLDGEHASSFVRAGHYESNDLNKLDTYSFIRSVNSNVSSTSPKGNTGWYNVIQLVHRNGASDGPSYIGQIALGMTTNTNDMFFRGKRTDPWKTVIHSGNIGNQTVANAYHLRINSANTWSTWYWAGQSGQPSWLWGSNDGTNMYVWNPSNFNVNTAQYLRSLGNQNCQTGRTQAYSDVYSYNTHNGNTGSPTTYSSVIGFGRGIAGTVEIAGGWCNTHLYWRSLRDCCEDWFPWRTVLDSSNYTEFINNYYWANVKISTSSSTTTSPTVSNLTATSSIRMSNISLEQTDEINNITNGGIHLNYRNSGNVSLCYGGGNVGIGTTTPSYKLDVNGQMRASGFHHSSVNSDNYILLAGGGYKSFGGDDSTPIFLGCLNLYRGGDGTISSSFYCLGYSVPFTYTRGGNYCKIVIPDTSRLSFYIIAATASVNYSGGGMDTWVGEHSGDGAWWLHCYAFGWNEVRVKGFRLANDHNDSWWGGNPLYPGDGGANKITVCIFGHVKYK